MGITHYIFDGRLKSLRAGRDRVGRGALDGEDTYDDSESDEDNASSASSDSGADSEGSM